MRRLIPGILLLASMAAGAGCNDDNGVTTPSTTTTTTTTTATVTETFSGTLNMNGAATYPFTAAAGGTVTATLTSVAPDSTVIIGLSLGSWTGSSCQLSSSIANDSATQGAVVTGTVTAAAPLCARVYDVGKVTAAQPVSFAVTIVHP
jgi:hypothetical protein